MNIDQSLKQLCNQYKFIKQLGEGGFAKVYLATHKGQKFALKCINKSKLIHSEKNSEMKMLKQRYLKSEVDIMKKCKSSNLIQLIREKDSNDWKVLVIQYCECGSLFDLITRKDRIPEMQAVLILAQIIKGFATLQKNNIIHRDLKSENILIRNGICKISDFGLSKEVQGLGKQAIGTTVGSRTTMAPEVSNQEEYDIQADIWSLGVIYYEMLVGYLPFTSIIITEKQIDNALSRNKTGHISKQSMKLLRSLLVIDPKKRLKWVQLYRMMNDGVDVFHNLQMKQAKQASKPPIVQHQKPPIKIPIQKDARVQKEWNYYRQQQQIRKVQHRIQQQEQQKQKHSRVEEEDFMFVKLMTDLQKINTLNEQVLRKVPHIYFANNGHQIPLNIFATYFSLMVAEQICRIATRNNSYLFLGLHPEEVKVITGNNQITCEFNRLASEMNRERLAKIQTLKSLKNKQFVDLVHLMKNIFPPNHGNKYEHDFMEFLNLEDERFVSATKYLFNQYRDRFSTPAEKEVLGQIKFFMDQIYSSLVSQ